DPSPDRLGAKLSASPCVPSVATDSNTVAALTGPGAALTADVPKSITASTPTVSPRFGEVPIGSLRSQTGAPGWGGRRVRTTGLRRPPLPQTRPTGCYRLLRDNSATYAELALSAR